MTLLKPGGTMKLRLPDGRWVEVTVETQGQPESTNDPDPREIVEPGAS